LRRGASPNAKERGPNAKVKKALNRYNEASASATKDLEGAPMLKEALEIFFLQMSCAASFVSRRFLKKAVEILTYELAISDCFCHDFKKGVFCHDSGSKRLFETAS